MSISLDGIPLENSGFGTQNMFKSEIFLLQNTDVDILIIEEPENNLSYSNMSILISKLSESNGKQLFISTHSSFVANKLGLQCLHLVANARTTPFKSLCDFINTIHGDADSMVEPDPNNQQEMPVENSGVYMMNVDSLREYCEYYHPIILRYDKKAKVGFQHDCDVFNYGGSKGATYERVVIIPVSTTLPFIERQVKITSNQTRAKFYVACTRAKHSVVFAMENPCENVVFKATDIHFSDKSIPAYKFSKPDSDI